MRVVLTKYQVLETTFDPLLKMLVEPLETDGHGCSSHLVHHHIAHAGSANTGNVERFAVSVPPFKRKAYVTDT
jgi:hypothetical protein